MGIPTGILWAVWVIGIIMAGVSVEFVIDGDRDARKIWGVFAIFCLLTIPWYLSGLHELDAYPYTTNIVGIVETETLKTGIKISVVKTDKEIINISDKFHSLLPDGATYTKLVKSNKCANGLLYNYDDIDGWAPKGN